MFQVTLTACVAGNPLKAWRDGEEPNDVWEDQTHDFGDDLEAAKTWIRGLDPRVTTHVVLLADGTPIYAADAADDLDAAHPDFVQQSQKPAVTDEPDVIEDVTPMASQTGGAQ